ncbi:MAG TPA: hypothetical protein VFY13_06285, partial [Luteolibacter sp.]|nr:hypothetical protein [Luteolibacter sp.]
GKIPEPELKAKQGEHKKSWLQRMAEKQAEIQKAQREGRGAGGNLRDVTPKKKRGPRTGG